MRDGRARAADVVVTTAPGEPLTAAAGQPLTVGVVGVGTMGMPVVANLVQAGFTVLGHRRSPMPAEFDALGARSVSSPAELAASCDVVLVLLPDADALLSVALGPAGLVEGARPGLVVAEMSTMPLEVKQRCHDALAERGAVVLDAPISGMPGMVRARTASVFASGDETAFARVRPVLDRLAGRVDHLGPFGAGSQTKFIAQLLLSVNTLAAAEALGLARRAGLDLDRLLEVLSGTIAGSAALSARGSRMVHGPYRPAPGPIATLVEGLEVVGEFAAALDARTPLFDRASGLWAQARDDGHADDDLAVMIDVLDAAGPGGPPVPPVPRPRVTDVSGVRGFELAVDGEVTLVLAEARFAERFAALVEVNRDHLQRFDPWAVELAEVSAARAALVAGLTRFAAGTEVPALVVVGGEIAGLVSLRVDVPARSGALGYWLGAASTGRGLATRAVRALSAFGFDELGLVRVSAQLEVDNTASREVVRRAGFALEGVVRSGAVAHGVVGDLEQWSLLPADGPASSP